MPCCRRERRNRIPCTGNPFFQVKPCLQSRTKTADYIHVRMPGRTRFFVLIAATLGAVQLISTVLNWHITDPKVFVTYLGLAVICSCLQIRYLGAGTAFSLNLLFILLSMVQLSRPEALAVGCAGMLAQCLWDPQTRSRYLQIALRVTMLAAAIATADFTCHSLIPRSMRNETLLLMFASAALFFANTFPAAIALRLNEERRIGQIWRESYFWSFPYYLVAAAIANAMRLVGRGISLESAPLVLPVLYLAYRYYRTQKSQLAEKEKWATDMAALHLRAVEGLAMAVEAKDSMNTRGHLRRVQVYALGLGKDLGLSEGELQALHAAALLHDIGKLAVPEHILTKPGKLSPEEFARMKVHPLVGAEIVEQVQFPYPVAPIVCAHHEKWDGSGYPFGLKGEEIPLAARILGAVDCLDALTSDREYRRALPLEDGMRQVASEAGRSFDPRVVEALERRYRELDLVARTNPDQRAALSTGVAVEKGKSPGAGLDLSAISGLQAGARPLDFQDAIATAGREEKMRLEMAQGIGSSLNLDETIQGVQQALRPLIPFAAIAFFVRKGDTLTVQHAAGENSEMLVSLQIPVGEGLVGWVAENGRPVANGNPTVDPGFVCHGDKALNSCLAMPLGPSGSLGVLALYRNNKDAFTRDDFRILIDAAPIIGVAVDNALKFREMERRSNIDGLTGLPNSDLMTQFLEAELTRARRQKQTLCVTLCRVSGLQLLKHKLGANAADQLFRSVAARMKESCRAYDLVARVGQDQFALVLPGMSSHDLPVKTARLDAIIASSSELVGGAGMVHFVFGKASYPDDADGAKPLLAIAERRMEQNVGQPTESILALDAATRDRAAKEEPMDAQISARPGDSAGPDDLPGNLESSS